jgi:hypothetical protein
VDGLGEALLGGSWSNSPWFLRAAAEEAKAKSHHADTRVVCDKPLTMQIEELMRSLSSSCPYDLAGPGWAINAPGGPTEIVVELL